MSSVTGLDYLAQKEYYQDQRRAANKHRQVCLALGNRAKSNRLVSKSLAWLGHRLVIWGSNLQKQYATVVTSSMSRSTNPVTTP